LPEAPQTDLPNLLRLHGRHYRASRGCHKARPTSPPRSNTRRRPGRVWFADEVAGGQLADVIAVQCLNAKFAPQLWSRSFFPLWSCSECTFVNEKPDALACLVCGTPRFPNEAPVDHQNHSALQTSAACADSLSTRIKDPQRGVKARPATPVRGSSSSSSRVGEHRSESRLAPEFVVEGTAGFCGPQAPAKSAAVPSSFDVSLARQGGLA